MEIRSADEAIARMTEGLDWLAENDSSLFCTGANIKAIERQGRRLESVSARAVGSFDQWGEWATDEARTATAWIDTTCHLPKKEANAQLRRGKALPGLPLVAEAWANGDIGAAQVDVMIGLKSPVTEEALAAGEAVLVDAACTMKFASFCTVANYWQQHADQDGSDEAAEARKAQRDVYLVPSMNGTYFGKMTLDPISGAIVTTELKRIEQELFDADSAEAKARLGRDPRNDELGRTAAQRRADALVEMAVRSAAAQIVEGRRPEPLFTVLIDYPTLWGRISQLEQGPVVNPGSLLRWMDKATFERIIFGPGKRAECSITSRFFTGATRRAIEVRDLECQHEFCDLPASQCQLDHIVPYSQGGPTDQGNGQLLCGPHNRERYERPPPDGAPDAPPDG